MILVIIILLQKVIIVIVISSIITITIITIIISIINISINITIISIIIIIIIIIITSIIIITIITITTKGCFILAGALRKNGVLEELIIDGNPIGYTGGEYLLATFNFHNMNRVISMKECLFSGMMIIMMMMMMMMNILIFIIILILILDKDAADHSIFDTDYPGGSYSLDLHLVYDR